MIKKLFTFLFVILLQLSCSSAKQNLEEQEIYVVDNDNLKLSLVQFEKIAQNILDLNQFDFLFSENDKDEGLIIVTNDFLKPFYKKLELYKFNKPVRFLNHETIYVGENEKFLDFLEGSIFLDGNLLNIMAGLRFKNTAINAQFVSENGEWVIINKNSNNPPEYTPKYRFKKDKEQCLTEQIKYIKTKEITIPSCLKYSFKN